MTQVIPFIEHGTTQQAPLEDDGAKVVVSAEPQPTGLGELARSAADGRLYIAVFAGPKRTGGFSVGVDRVVRDGARLVIHARFVEPPQSAVVIQVLTSPAALISIDRRQAAGARTAVLVDQRNAEVARTAVPQSGL